jgi:hypothetical protein
VALFREAVFSVFSSCLKFNHLWYRHSVVLLTHQQFFWMNFPLKNAPWTERKFSGVGRRFWGGGDGTLGIRSPGGPHSGSDLAGGGGGGKHSRESKRSFLLARKHAYVLSYLLACQLILNASMPACNAHIHVCLLYVCKSPCMTADAMNSGDVCRILGRYPLGDQSRDRILL